MALNLLTNPASTPTVSSDWTNLVAREDAAGIGVGTGIRTFSLTNVGTTTKPAVAIGSIIEVGGSIYQADSDTALTDDTGLADGTVHIKLVPSGTTVIPTLTNDSIPVWDSEKGGWYDVDDKFLPFEMTKASSSYANKCEYVNQNKTVKVCDDGSAYLDGDLDVGGDVNGVTLSDGDVSCGDIFSSTGIKSGSTTSAVKWKVFTGTLDSSGDKIISHGLTYSNILGISSVVKNSGGYYSELMGVTGSEAFATSTDLIIRTGDSDYYSQSYRVVVFYI